jgi:hypothetical protein
MYYLQVSVHALHLERLQLAAVAESVTGLCACISRSHLAGLCESLEIFVLCSTEGF